MKKVNELDTVELNAIVNHLINKGFTNLQFDKIESRKQTLEEIDFMYTPKGHTYISCAKMP